MTTKVQLTKAQAIEIFGSKEALYEAMGNGEYAIGRWPDPLTERLTRAVTGAALLGDFIYHKDEVLKLARLTAKMLAEREIQKAKKEARAKRAMKRAMKNNGQAS